MRPTPGAAEPAPTPERARPAPDACAIPHGRRTRPRSTHPARSPSAAIPDGACRRHRARTRGRRRRRTPRQGPPAPDVEPARAVRVGTHRPKAKPRPARRPARRIEGLLLGLAAGDAAGWPAARHRAARMPEWTRRLTRELDTFAEQNATTTLPVPIALNQPPEPLRLGPSDDAEWAAFAAEAVLRAGDDTVLGDLSRSAVSAPPSTSPGTPSPARSPPRPTAPPRSSRPCSPCAPVSPYAPASATSPPVCARPPPATTTRTTSTTPPAYGPACSPWPTPATPDAAAELAEFDARYTQDGDGVHGARAMAAALAAGARPARTSRPAWPRRSPNSPQCTEIGRNARHALKLARTAGRAPSPWSRSWSTRSSTTSTATASPPPRPSRSPSPWPPPRGGRIAEAVPAAACLSRVADSAPALAGALTGALGGGAVDPGDLARRLPHPLRLRPAPPHRHRPGGTRRTAGSHGTGHPRRMIRA